MQQEGAESVQFGTLTFFKETGKKCLMTALTSYKQFNGVGSAESGHKFARGALPSDWGRCVPGRRLVTATR